MNRKLVRAWIGAVAVVGLLGLAACNTVEGIGKDVEQGGQKLQDVAK